MSTFEIYAPFYGGRRNAKCRACQYWGKDPANTDLFTEECQLAEAPIRHRHRDHNDRACSKFKLVDWLKQPGEE